LGGEAYAPPQAGVRLQARHTMDITIKEFMEIFRRGFKPEVVEK
jgi:hypothetical protein